MSLNNMTEKMNSSLPHSLDAFESVDTTYSEVVNISLDNTASKRFICNLCEFKSNDKGGMKRHITTKHKPQDGLFKRKREDTNNDNVDDKKARNDTPFYPEASSTQKSRSPLNRTASELSNESLANLLSDKYEFSQVKGDDEEMSFIKNSPKKQTHGIYSDSVKLPRADLAIQNMRIKKLEEELKLKTLELVEKDGCIEALENENFVYKEDITKLKDDLQLKNTTIESNIGNINILEEKLRRQTERVQILEPAVNRFLSKSINSDEACGVSKLKNDLKSKNEIIKQLNEDKISLTNELRDLQEKSRSEKQQDIVDKCIKLTTDLNKAKSDNKTLEKEKKKPR